MKRERYYTLLVLMLIISIFAGSLELLRELAGQPSVPWQAGDGVWALLRLFF